MTTRNHQSRLQLAFELVIGISSLPFSRARLSWLRIRQFAPPAPISSNGLRGQTAKHFDRELSCAYIKSLRFAFDPAKDAINRSKHGVSLSEAARLDWNRVLAKLDTRTDYGQPRQIGYGPIGRRLCCVVFVDRGDTLRIISLRKANNREIDRYETQINSSDRA